MQTVGEEIRTPYGRDDPTQQCCAASLIILRGKACAAQGRHPGPLLPSAMACSWGMTFVQCSNRPLAHTHWPSSNEQGELRLRCRAVFRA